MFGSSAFKLPTFYNSACRTSVTSQLGAVENVREDHFKFDNDMFIPKVINFINIGLASHNTKQEIPNDISNHKNVVPQTQASI